MFSKCARARDGLQAWCKGCQRNWLECNRDKRRAQQRAWIEKQKTANPDRYFYRKRLKHYGLSIETYRAMLAGQDHRCASCRDELGEDWWSTHVDHCHETGKIRGILCRGCNLGLGQLKDEAWRVNALLIYITAHQ